jgi:hypothetical protein
VAYEKGETYLPYFQVTLACVSLQSMCDVKLYDLWSATNVPVGCKLFSHLSHPQL